MIAFIHLPMARYVVPGGGAHAEEAAAASVAGGLLILAKNEGDCSKNRLFVVSCARTRKRREQRQRARRPWPAVGEPRPQAR